MRTEIFIEGYALDLMNDLPTEFTYAIDDIQDFGSKNTSFSKTLNIPGSAKNNQIFGFIFDLGNANFTDNAQPNVLYNFNATRASQCRIFVDGIQIFKGILRLLEIVKTGEVIEYQCSVFGELGGFITALGNKKLEDITFPLSYEKQWNYTNITASWDNINGSDVYYPLIDIGGVSTNQIDFQFNAFLPSLYAKDYMERIFSAAGYTYDFPLLNTNLFNRLVIPANQATLSSYNTLAFNAVPNQTTIYTSDTDMIFNPATLGNFTANGTNTQFTYTGTSTTVDIDLTFNVTANDAGDYFNFQFRTGTSLISEQTINVGTGSIDLSIDGFALTNGDVLRVVIDTNSTNYEFFGGGEFKINLQTPVNVPYNYNEYVKVYDMIPKGIFQKDFFLSICKMFNLYVYEDQWDSKKLIIKPYIDFYDGSFIDWSNKIDRSKPMGIKPMSEINARYYQFKYKSDNDYFNENYKKKFNEGYGDRLFDSELDFVKDTDSTELIFAASSLYQFSGTDKIYPAIYKLSDNNTKKDRIDFAIRILQAKKITGRSSWKIKNGATDLVTLTTYGYGGHLDDPFSPSNDINFGVPQEIYFTASTYPTTNLFNAYYSDYMAEITDKDSKLLTCEALLNMADIQNLDFSKLIMVDNILFRLNKVDGYSITDYKTVKLELLKAINKTF
jgi:hypothetical protein